MEDGLNVNSACAQIKEKPDVGVYVKDLSTVVVKNADDMDKIMTTGNSHRECRHVAHVAPHTPPGKTGETSMNARSSRSHAIFTIVVERSDKVSCVHVYTLCCDVDARTTGAGRQGCSARGQAEPR